MPDYFNDQAAMLRRMVEQHLDPDRNSTADELARHEREDAEYHKADFEQDDCERWDGQS